MLDHEDAKENKDHEDALDHEDHEDVMVKMDIMVNMVNMGKMRAALSEKFTKVAKLI